MNHLKRETEFELVSAMNIAFGNLPFTANDFRQKVAPRGVLGTVPVNPEAWPKVQRQLRNVLDEINELDDAIRTLDVAKVRDALCDIRVFAHGGHHYTNYTGGDGYVISNAAPIPAMLVQLHPLLALKAAYQYMMVAVREQDYHNTNTRISLLIWLTHKVGENLGIGPEQQYADMQAVMAGVMSRFVKNADDMKATMAKHAAKGVTQTYVEGEFPTAILKSAADQSDAPQGKFLKSASYNEPIFNELYHVAEVEQKIAGLMKDE